MSIPLIDSIKFHFYSHGIEGSHVSGVMLVDELHHPDLMKGRAVLHTTEKRIDFHSPETGMVAGSIDLTAYDDSEIQAALTAVTATANAADALSKEADALSKANQSELATVKTTANAAHDLAKSNQSNFSSLSQTTGEHSTAIANNAKSIGDNATAITTKASQSEVDALTTTVSTKAPQSEVDALNQEIGGIAINAGKITDIEGQISGIETEVTTAKQIAEKASTDVADLKPKVDQNAAAISTKAEQSSLDALSGTVGQNTTQITANTKSTSDNATAIATKASQADLDAVATTANAADTLSKANAVEAAKKVETDSNASVNSLTNKTGNYDSQEDFDLKVSGTNVLSATQSAIHPKKNIVFQSESLIKGLGNAVDSKDAMNKQSVESITNALSTRLDGIAEGAGDESDYISVHGFDGLMFEGQNLLDFMIEKDGDTQCHIVFNAIRHSYPASNIEAGQWVMRQYVHSDHPIWKFCPANISLKDGIVNIQHTGALGVTVTITTESEILAKQMHYNFGNGSNGRRNDWQIWHPRVKGYEGFAKGQVLTDSDITWSVSSNIRTNMQRLRDAIPVGCTFIGWHNHNASDNKYKIIAKGTGSSIEGTSGSFIIWKHGGTSSTGGLYVNSASSSAEGWSRSYIGQANAWVSFGKQENRSSATRFEGVNELVVPYYEDPPALTLFFIACASDDLLQTKVNHNGAEYQSVGRYEIKWDGTWTRSEAMHTAYYNGSEYIAYDQLTYTWIKFTAAKNHEAEGLQAVNQRLAAFNKNSDFPASDDLYVDFGDLDTLAYQQIAQPQFIHNTTDKTSTLPFNIVRWGYVEGGGLPSDDGEYPDNGVDPVDED